MIIGGLLLSLLLNSFVCQAHDGPQSDTRMPNVQIKTDSKEEPARLRDIVIDVKIIGNIAVTTWDMTIYNPQNRILEGELIFPLEEGKTVTRFALDINGKLREGVVVEKAKGRTTFEAIVRRGVDPGLLEKLEGNNFRARVYPIPAHGIRRMVLAYEHELEKSGSDTLLYTLPLAFQTRLDNFSIRMEALEQLEKPIIVDSSLSNFQFDSWQRGFVAEKTIKNHIPNKSIKVNVPMPQNSIQTFVEEKNGKAYFYATVVPQFQRKSKALPEKLGIFWDASGSAETRNTEREINLLKAYLKHIGDAEVQLIVFRNDVEPVVKFSVRNGVATKLFEYIKSLPLDGATRFADLKFGSIKVDEALLFSDGMNTFGPGNTAVSPYPIIIINSALQSDHGRLKMISESSGGEYLNLFNTTDDTAINNLITIPLAFIRATYPPDDVSEVYPHASQVVKDQFGIAGVLNTNQTQIVLHFGYNGSEQFKHTINIDKKNIKTSAPVSRLWAVKKLEVLSLDKLKFKNEILRLGQTHTIVTDETSLIVLEEIDDYVRYEIEPPDELLAEFRKRMDKKQELKTKDNSDVLTRVIRQFEERKIWWDKKFDKAQELLQTIESGSSSLVREVIDYGSTGSQTSSITLTAVDVSGSPVANARVSLTASTLNGPRIGQTNQNGVYSTRLLPPGAYIIVVSKKGFQTGITTRLIIADQHYQPRFTMSSVVGPTVEVVASSMEDVPPPPPAPPQPPITDQEAIPDSAPEAISTVDYSKVYAAQQDSNLGVGGTVASEVSLRFFDPDFTTFSIEVMRIAASEVPANQTTDTIGLKDTKASIELKSWNSNAPYLSELEKTAKENMYRHYLSLKPQYQNVPGFYVDVAELFMKNGDTKMALRILSNLAEIKIEDAAILKVLAYKLRQLKYNSLAVEVFERILAIREEEPQSYRDLGLASADIGEEQRAIELLWKVVSTKWNDRFRDINLIACGELNSIIANSKQKIDYSMVDQRLLHNMPVDIRVVLNWDTDNSDMDLHVTDPTGETCYYSRSRTEIGGRISADVTQGYGPEEFLLKKAVPGKYVVKTKYYGTRQQTAIGPTTVFLEFYTRYATGHVENNSITLRLTNKDGMVDIGEFIFK